MIILYCKGSRVLYVDASFVQIRIKVNIINDLRWPMYDVLVTVQVQVDDLI